MTINCLCFVPFLLQILYNPISFKLWILNQIVGFGHWFSFYPVYSKFYCNYYCEFVMVCCVSLCVILSNCVCMWVGLFQLYGRIWDALSYFGLYLYVQVQVFGFLFYFFVPSFNDCQKLEWNYWQILKMKKSWTDFDFARTLIEWDYCD